MPKTSKLAQLRIFEYWERSAPVGLLESVVRDFWYRIWWRKKAFRCQSGENGASIKPGRSFRP